MPTELALAIQQICDEKNLSKESVKETIESALASAYRKDFGNKQQNLHVDFSLDTGDFEVYDVKEVVEDELQKKYEEMRNKIEELKATGDEIPDELKQTTPNPDEDGEEEEEKRFNPKTMISLAEAKETDKKSQIGEELITKLEIPSEFGRMAAQTAKQVIIQKIREAEREGIFNLYKDKQGELINGTVQRKEGSIVLVDIGDTTAIIPPQDQIRSENYRAGARMKFYLKSVEQTPRGPEVVVSRAHPEMVRKLFKLEVPEIGTGTVQIKAISREAGSRSKVAVWTKDDSIDPIGSAVGQRGTRVQTIINELGGEKIDIIEWSEDVEYFIIKSLAPAKIEKVELNEEEKVAKAYVKEDQYSLAIGKEGQNVRLAAKLTGWKIDIVQAGGIKEEGGDENESEEVAEESKEVKAEEKDLKEVKEETVEEAVEEKKESKKEKKEKKKKEEK
ncbi:MAG: transcription termination factor NusA [Patescibacteria group bacterium]